VAINYNIPPANKTTRTAFTLVELLVVLAVIAILVAILLSVFSRVRENGRAVQCSSNLHEVALGLTQYMDDNDGFYPCAGAVVPWDTIDPTSGRGPWMQQIFPYIKNQQIYQCPDDTNSAYSYFLGARAAYIALGTLGSVDHKRIEFPAAYVLSGDTFSAPPGVPNDPTLFYSTDADKDDYSQDCVGGAAAPAMQWQRHKGGQNIAFADGHVKWFGGYNPGLMTFRYAGMQGW
jgi:prepilin-type N-terminal cleavage/methylation domain-containing protein/prepilin-type processing-associated H-X9-DG protein